MALHFRRKTRHWQQGVMTDDPCQTRCSRRFALRRRVRLAGSHTFIVPPVDTPSGIHLSEIDVAFGIRCDAVNVGKLAKAVTAIATEETHEFHGCAVHDLYFFVRPIGDVEEALLLVIRKGGAESRSKARGSLALDVDLLDECSIETKRLNAIIHAVAYIHHSVTGHGDPMDRVELLRSRAFISARTGSSIIRLVAVRSP